jgi:hypothetical protein
MVLRRIFGLKREEVVGRLTKRLGGEGANILLLKRFLHRFQKVSMWWLSYWNCISFGCWICPMRRTLTRLRCPIHHRHILPSY